MVFFSCNGCGEALKKNQVEKHSFQCRNATFSCIDCQLVFTHETFKGHIKCITENQKYGGKNYVEKENKGEIKQNAWVDQVNGAIDAVQNREVKELLKNVAGFGNIPRKEAKFINFLMNSCKLRDRNLALRAWQAIAAEAEKMRLDAIQKQEEMQKAEREQKEAAAAAAVTSKNEKETVEEKKNEETETITNFKWKKVIKRKLKENGGEMKVKKLRKEVLQAFNEAGGESENPHDLFTEKLEKCSNIQVTGKVAQLQ